MNSAIANGFQAGAGFGASNLRVLLLSVLGGLAFAFAVWLVRWASWRAARRAGLSPSDVDRMVQPRTGVPAVVTHSDNHEHNIHVRFRCGPEDAGCRE